MPKLPFEILKKIFSYLEEKDLVQCQLTSKTWYQSSVEHLYSKPTVDTYEKADLYICTISNSLQLGNYLHHIDVTHLSKREGDSEPWEDTDLLNILIQNCPNLMSISCEKQNEPFWHCIAHAASQGQLSRLQTLPYPDSSILPFYIDTVLLFKDSLVSIYIWDHDLFEVGNDLISIDAYQTLQDEISEFKKLEKLEIDYQSEKQLSDFDELIDDCHQLKELTIHVVFPDPPTVMIEAETRIRVCPKIISFDCFWRMIDNESQLRYVMQKFPNLQYLKVLNPFYGKHVPQRCPCDAMVEFLHYAINKIPQFEIGLHVERKDLAFVYEKLVETKSEYQNIITDYGYDADVILKIARDSIEIVFPIYKEDFTQIEFFTLAGKSIRLLKMQGISAYTQYTSYSPVFAGVSNSIDWLFNTLQLFTSLETLMLAGISTELSSSGLVCQNESIKALHLTRIRYYGVSINFLKYMSLNLPNINHLHLSFNCDPVYYGPIIITMQDTYLELLTCIFERDEMIFYNMDQIYIRLDTKTGVEFYKSHKLFLSKISEHNYNSKSKERLCFEITCLNLKEFTIGFGDRPKLYTWCFPIPR